VEIIIDTSDAPGLVNFGQVVKSTLVEWFDRVGDILESPTYTPPSQINVYFDPNYDGVAYASGNNIVGSVDYYLTHQDDIGSMVHEMAHVIQSYRSCYTNDDWYITEGIADWVRFFHYEPASNRPPKPGSDNHYSQGYRVTAYFLDWVNARYNPMIYWINKDCREGTYNHQIFDRLTGKSIDQHWQEMLASLGLPTDLKPSDFEKDPYGYDHKLRHKILHSH